MQRFVKYAPEVYVTYVATHAVVGAGCGAYACIDSAMNDGGRSIIIAPFAVLTGGLMGTLAGLIPGITPIVGVGLLYKKSTNHTNPGQK